MPVSQFKIHALKIFEQIAYRSTVLPQPFHHDPGDQIIVATAREENPLLSARKKYLVSSLLIKKKFAGSSVLRIQI